MLDRCGGARPKCARNLPDSTKSSKANCERANNAQNELRRHEQHRGERVGSSLQVTRSPRTARNRQLLTVRAIVKKVTELMSKSKPSASVG